MGMEEVVVAAKEAAADGICVLLFGPKSELTSLVASNTTTDGSIKIIDSPEVITNEEEPARAARSRTGASVVAAARSVARGEADALVSAGATGATLAASVLHIKRLRGVYRPALAVLLPLPGKPVLLLDVGAGTEARSEQLVQFAYMGAALAEIVLDVESPTVALLSVGEESGKGTEVVATAHAELAKSTLDFIGNVEGRDLPAGRSDVVVTDGFTGNISLKLMEGTAATVKSAIADAARSTLTGKMGGLLLRSSLQGMRAQLDPNNTGGALLLGLRACSVVAHGNSTSAGIANAIRLADRTVRGRVVQMMAESLERGGALRGAAVSADGDTVQMAADADKFA